MKLTGITSLRSYQLIRICGCVCQLFHDLSSLSPRQRYVFTDAKPAESQFQFREIFSGESSPCRSFRQAPSSRPHISECIYCVLPVQQIRPTVMAETEVVHREKGVKASPHPLLVLPSMCWFEWPDSNHGKTDSGEGGTTAVLLGKRTDWRGSFQKRHFAAHGVSLPCHWVGGCV